MRGKNTNRKPPTHASAAVFKHFGGKIVIGPKNVYNKRTKEDIPSNRDMFAESSFRSVVSRRRSSRLKIGILTRDGTMLVLSRKVGERILIGDEIAVTVVRVGQGMVRIGVEAPQNLSIVREEIKDAATTLNEGDESGAC